MYFKSISEKDSISFAKKLLDYYRVIDDNSINTILTSNDLDSARNNAGWYNYRENQHHIYINVPNIMCANYFISKGVIDVDSFYAFLTLCTSHEFRHFLQGRCIYDGIDSDGYNQEDVLNAELMLYIRYFFDAYYLLNKGNIKYELDAEKFAVEKGEEYLKKQYPSMNAEKAMVSAVSFYADIQTRGGIESTLPVGCKSIEEIIDKLTERLEQNKRIPTLDETLFVHNPRFYSTHSYFGLDEEKVITEELLNKYLLENDGSKRDLIVVKRILELLDKPLESLEEFPHLRKDMLIKNYSYISF